MKINKNIIKELNDYLEEFNLNEIEYTEKDIKVKVSKSRVTKNIETSLPINENKIKKDKTPIENSKKITSPIIGTAYLAPEPGGKKFIEIGQRIKNGVQCIITNSRHCSFGYDQRVELFGSKGMLISGNKSENETEIFTRNNTSQKKPLLNFFIDRYVDAYRLQLDELANYSRKKKMPISSFEDGRRALIIANAASHSLKLRKQIKIKY